ncbi:MAG: hypothetical protein R3362_00810 [Rhodothermales bacterium]|nr:hypothetical protein [Rhodothermales bacterium]
MPNSGPLRRLALAVLLAAAPAALAQDAPATDVAPADAFIDFAVPDLSAATLLDVSASRVAQPGTVRELAVSLIEIAEATGDAAQGTGIEWALFRTLAAPRSVRDYRARRALYNLTLSGAVAREGDAARLAVGLRWVPFNEADPLLSRDLERLARSILRGTTGGPRDPTVLRREVVGPLDDLLETFRLDAPQRIGVYEVFPPIPNADPDATVRSLTDAALAALDAEGVVLNADQQRQVEEVAFAYVLLRDRDRGFDVAAWAREEIRAMKDSLQAANWNARAFHVTTGATWTSPTAELGDIEADAFSAFAGLSLPIEFQRGRDAFDGQFLLQARADLAFDPDAAEPRAYSGGARLLLGSATLRGVIEGTARYGDRRRAGDDRLDWRVVAGGEFRISPVLWLEVSAGLNLPEGEGAGLLTLGNLKYGFRPKSPLP